MPNKKPDRIDPQSGPLRQNDFELIDIYYIVLYSNLLHTL